MKIQFAMLLLVSLSLGSCKNDIKTPPEGSITTPATTVNKYTL